jgi:ribonuclease Z
MTMQVITLGTGSPLPTSDRAGPATLVRADGVDLLFDCGRGVLLRLAAVGLPFPGFLRRVFLTHLHSDHTTDLNDLITTAWITTPGTTDPVLGVTGPPGTAALVDRTLAMLVEDVAYRIAHHDDLEAPPTCDVHEVLEGPAFEAGGVTVVAAPTDHRPVHPTVGYRVESGGKVVVIAGDTVPCGGLDRLCAGADVLVHTVIRPDLIRQIPAARLQDVIDYHSSCEDAGRTAARAGVRTLVLTHPVPAPAPDTEQDWLDQARTQFTGEVVLASDLTAVEA